MKSTLSSSLDRDQRRAATLRIRPRGVFAAVCGLAVASALMGAAAEAADSLAIPNCMAASCGPR